MTPTAPAYEQLLSGPIDGALREASMHFEQKSAVHQTLRKIAKRLDQLHIPYAVVGGMALFLHGFRRFTEDVDILVTADGLQAIHQQLEGAGYLPLFTGSKNLRNTEYGVRIEFLVAGQYPGDGQPKPVAFPDPATVQIEHDGIRFLPLKNLVELKLASGMTNPARLRDLADVQDLIRTLALPADFAEELDEYVRAVPRVVEEHSGWRIIAKQVIAPIPPCPLPRGGITYQQRVLSLTSRRRPISAALFFPRFTHGSVFPVDHPTLFF